MAGSHKQHLVLAGLVISWLSCASDSARPQSSAEGLRASPPAAASEASAEPSVARRQSNPEPSPSKSLSDFRPCPVAAEDLAADSLDEAALLQPMGAGGGGGGQPAQSGDQSRGIDAGDKSSDNPCDDAAGASD